MISVLRAHIVPAALTLLPDAMRDGAVIAPLLAIAWQESRAKARRQIVRVNGEERPGPAMGFWQFEELGAVKGVLSHAATSAPARELIAAMGYSRDLTARQVWERLEHNDVLAAGFARLLLWTLPQALPTTQTDGWLQYYAAWRPGKPHPETWGEAWRRGWATT